MLKLKSKSDVVNNSSAEVYAVKTGLSAEEVEREWYSFLESCEESKEYGTLDDPQWTGVFDATIKEKEPGVVVIDYPVLCNIDGFKDKLEELFGNENVIDGIQSDYWENWEPNTEWLKTLEAGESK